MRTVERKMPAVTLVPGHFIRWQLALFAVFFAGWIGSQHLAQAHPLSQGAMEARIFPEKIELRTRVPVEQVFLAVLLPNEKEVAPDAAWEIHGHYLLKHIQLSADGRKLTGHLVKFISPDSTNRAPAATPVNDVEYLFEYSLNSEPGNPLTHRPLPTEIRLEQDVLRDFETVPGQSWETTFMVRVQQQHHAPVEGLLLTAKEPVIFPCDWNGDQNRPISTGPQLNRWRMAKEYLRHGFFHILAGWDHLLFIGGLVLAVATFWDLVKVITAFTLAHTITLTLAVLDCVRLSDRIVEPMIAASIVIVALQNLFWPERSRGAGRLLLAFFFGLFHGLGFAGGLLHAMEGMSGAAVGIAIASFSVGVELGHQVVVLPVFAILKQMRGRQKYESGRVALSEQFMRFGSAVILLAGLFYLFTALV